MAVATSPAVSANLAASCGRPSWRRKCGADAFLGVSDPFDLSRLMKRDRCSASAVGADLAASASRWNPTRFNRSSSSSPAPICRCANEPMLAPIDSN